MIYFHVNEKVVIWGRDSRHIHHDWRGILHFLFLLEAREHNVSRWSQTMEGFRFLAMIYFASTFPFFEPQTDVLPPFIGQRMMLSFLRNIENGSRCRHPSLCHLLAAAT